MVSPEGGDLTADPWSDPRDEIGYSVDDILTLGFITSPEHSSLVQATPALAAIDRAAFDAIFIVGGQSPMVTMADAPELQFVGRRIQPFWIEEEARKMEETNFVVSTPFRPHAIRDGKLITGQQQYSGAAAVELVVEALGR